MVTVAEDEGQTAADWVGIDGRSATAGWCPVCGCGCGDLVL